MHYVGSTDCPLGGQGAHASPKPSYQTSRGHCLPFGATPRPGGVNFALFSRHASAVHLLLFHEGKETPCVEFALDPAIHRTGDVWHIFVHGLAQDILYGYRLVGPQVYGRPGHRYCPSAIVVDPYARALSGGERWGIANGRRLGRIDVHEFDWKDDTPPRTPLGQTVIYEMHVRGFTRHPSSGVKHPGTFLGLCEKIPYLKSLGITAVQLMPVLEFDERERDHQVPGNGDGLKNYWGYSPLSFFAPKASYAARARQQVNEFKEMVKAFHRAGLEVILDVVYNHTGEGDERGPTFGFRGLDNIIYYILDKSGRYYNFSGCGNTLNCNHPVVRDLILDSLSYLVSELHVDGFRFDLAAILGRGPDGQVLDDPPLLRHIDEHPVLAGTKLLVEAWDAGQSLQGRFPAWGRWAEFNAWFRDDVRRFVAGEANAVAGIGKRLCGSLDLFGDTSRHPYHSLNFVTCHDGFTLHDLVSYSRKHNLANGENNRDGWDWNYSHNHGHEGPTTNPEINAVRLRQMKNFLTLLFVAQGVPLLLMGDEMGRTQQGNNNAYCQDNEISWVDWSLTEQNAGLLRFTRLMIGLRQRFFALGRDEFVTRVRWHGNAIGEPDWSGKQRLLAFHLLGGGGRPHLYAAFNAGQAWERCALPTHEGRREWRRLVDTNLVSPLDIIATDREAVALIPADAYVLAPRSAVLLVAWA